MLPICKGHWGYSMSFLSYSLTYYTALLRELEHDTPTAERIYRAKQALKMLDDLLDEGYTELAETLEQSVRGVTRLRGYLDAQHAAPFPLPAGTVTQHALTYSTEQTELTEAIEQLTAQARHAAQISSNPFLHELLCFCDWLGYEPDTAYIFLLRDTMLPFIRFAAAGRTQIHPWLLGRSTMRRLTAQENTDDVFRASIIEALETGRCRSYDEFCRFVLPDIREKLRSYPEAEAFLRRLLRDIPQKKLIVVESGCYGTFPMLLMSLDSRADLRMYTTVPYLADVYADRIYTRAYENNRLFETLDSQDLYFRLSAVEDGRFYVNRCCNPEVEVKALAEVKAMLTGLEI